MDNLELQKKLSCKWVSISERLPTKGYDTLLFTGAIPEPTTAAWYCVAEEKWLTIETFKEVIVQPHHCWLEYGHLDYPENKM